jgi:hypothetical protein
MRRTDLCRQCQTGLAPGQEKTFHPDCSGCQDKLARGLRTGTEPRPVSFTDRVRKPAAEFTAQVQRLAQERAAARRLYGTYPGRAETCR